MREGAGVTAREPGTMAYYHALRNLFTPLVKRFERHCYDNGLAQVIDACPLRGMVGAIAGVTVRTYVLAGRVLLTFERQTPEGNIVQVTLMAAEGEHPSRLGLHTASEPMLAAYYLLMAVTWGYQGACVPVLAASADVGIG